MPGRKIVAEELSYLLKVLSNADRIRIIEELHLGEKDVNTLQSIIQTSHSRVSQHLSQLKSHKLVKERREGKHKYYSLVRDDIADWLIRGVDYLESNMVDNKEINIAVKQAKKVWTTTPNKK